MYALRDEILITLDEGPVTRKLNLGYSDTQPERNSAVYFGERIRDRLLNQSTSESACSDATQHWEMIAIKLRGFSTLPRANGI
jgi:hypothetical protein